MKLSVASAAISSLWILVFLSVTQCESHIASLVGGRDKPPPFMINRVARDPSIRPLENDWIDGGMTGGGGNRISFMKSPHFHARHPPYKFTLIRDSDGHRYSQEKYSEPEAMEATPAALVSDGVPEDEPPTFTPFIGARALSNMDEFFKQLRENIQAIQTDETGTTSGEIGQPERRRLVSPPQSIEFKNGPQGNDQFRGGDGVPAGEIKPWRGVLASGLHGKKLSFVQPLTAEEAHLRRAGGYNPAWLWTNMGLGKRGRR